MKSPEWRARRNRALRAAGWCCERCGNRRDLAVHHRTYERLGCEWDQDLRVLCRSCHAAHHVAILHDRPHERVYLKLAREALAAEPFTSIADLSEATKRLCARHRIPYDGPRLHYALNLLTRTLEYGTAIATAAPASSVDRPLTDSEARDVLETLISRPDAEADQAWTVDDYTARLAVLRTQAAQCGTRVPDGDFS